jgi:mannosyl-3-phosphoglycerate phosphatase
MFAAEGIALVLCSSMTRAEIDICQQDLGLVQPFICESGAAIVVPHAYFPFDAPRDRHLACYDPIEFGRPHADVAALLHATARRLDVPIVSFSEMSIEHVATECELSLSQARLAKLREYAEPFRILDDAPEGHERLWRGLATAGLTCTHRGQFDHVGAPVDIITSINVLLTLYRQASPSIVSATARGPTQGAIVEWIDLVIALAGRVRTVVVHSLSS